MIAMALACEPAVLIADEPTTALDVTIQAQILRLIVRMRESHGAAVVLITHDLGVVARLADRVAVMYAGRIVEQGSVRDLFHRPQHPYTWGLLESIPRIDRARIERLHSIAGQPPSLIGLGEGCAFRDALRVRVRALRGDAAARAARGRATATSTRAGSTPAIKQQRGVDAAAS